MRRFFASLDAALCAAGRWLLQPLGTRIAVVALLSVHAALLAYSATQHSPTHLEPAFLASGISHWHFGRFELYRVNPPLPRMIAALPALTLGCKTDWSQYRVFPGSRSEFRVGADFIKANGPRSIELFVYARWVSISFSLFGGFFAFRWANELYGTGAGLFTLFLWSIEPNLLAHAELVTADSACWSFGVIAGYFFWCWLKRPTSSSALIAGIALGLAQLTKFTWILLFPLWSAIWVASVLAPWVQRMIDHRLPTSANTAESAQLRTDFHQLTSRLSQFGQLLLILVTAIYVINAGYCAEGAFTRLKDYSFVSGALAGSPLPEHFGNKFGRSWLGAIPVPLPQQYILGIDAQQKDLEDWRQPCYLHGTWLPTGCWYYYLYGLAVKLPCGIIVAFILVAALRTLARPRIASCCRELVLIAPALFLLSLASLNTELTGHLRYVYPTLAFGLVWLGQLGPAACSQLDSLGLPPRTSNYAARSVRAGLTACMTLTLLATASVYPHHLSYFNELVGGASNGHKHLLGSSFDWGQHWLTLAASSTSGCPRIGVVSDCPYDVGFLNPRLVSLPRTKLGTSATHETPGSPSQRCCIHPDGRFGSYTPMTWNGKIE